MSAQPSLFAMLPRLEREFDEFDAANPEVWDLFRRFAFEAILAGRRRFSADAIMHRIRWFTQIETTGRPFKLNDHYSAFYARKFVRCFQKHAGLFELRRRKERTP